VIRRFTLADFDHCYSICRKMYPDRAHLGVPWALECTRRSDHLVLVSPHGVGISHIYWKYGVTLIGVLDLLTVEPGHPWEALKLLRAMIDWAKSNGAKRYTLSSDTGVDLGPLATRLSGKRADASYHVFF